MRRPVARAVYTICKAAGLFAFARRRMRGHLRILCYHGFSIDDEVRFRPSLFLDPTVLDQRMRYLTREGFRVVSLDQAAQELEAGELAPDTVTITIDDGFYSTYAAALPVFERHQVPATLYLTSYYFEKATPIFQLAVDYICWKSAKKQVDVSGLGVPELDRIGQVQLDSKTRHAISTAAFTHGSGELDLADRERLAALLGDRLGVDYGRICESRILSLVSPAEVAALEAGGVAIELHTHRHRFPLDAKQAVEEIEANRAVLMPLVNRPMRHFCYPSGFYAEEHLPALREAGILTATTCQAGLVRPNDNLLMLPRVLDDSRVSQIEFEAEMSGFSEMIRGIRRKFWAGATPLTVSGDWVINTTMPVLAI